MTSPNTKAMNQQYANKLRDRALEISQQETKSRLELAAIIHELYYGTVQMGAGELELYKFFGYDTWFDYVETEIGLHVTTAASYRVIHQVFAVELAGTCDHTLLSGVSFTKLRALTHVVDAKSVNGWLKKAQKLTCCKLDEEIEVARYGARKRGAHRAFQAMVTDRQLTQMNAILALAYEEFPDAENRADALLRIMEQWDAAVRKLPRKLAKTG